MMGGDGLDGWCLCPEGQTGYQCEGSILSKVAKLGN